MRWIHQLTPEKFRFRLHSPFWEDPCAKKSSNSFRSEVTTPKAIPGFNPFWVVSREATGQN